MKRSQRMITLLILLAAGVIMISLSLLKSHCPQAGIAFSRERRTIHTLKNRSALPQQTDFDDRISLPTLLQPGDDSGRWSTSAAAKVEGYVVGLAEGPIELANCYSPWSRDIHIHVALRLDAPPREQLVLEITPKMADWARRRGWDWSEATLKQELMGHRCFFEGWMFFDSAHQSESENSAPGHTSNWRATAWEIHPVTQLKVIR